MKGMMNVAMPATNVPIIRPNSKGKNHFKAKMILFGFVFLSGFLFIDISLTYDPIKFIHTYVKDGKKIRPSVRPPQARWQRLKKPAPFATSDPMSKPNMERSNRDFSLFTQISKIFLNCTHISNSQA